MNEYDVNDLKLIYRYRRNEILKKLNQNAVTDIRQCKLFLFLKF